MSTGDIRNNLERLRRALRSIRYNGPFNEEDLRKGRPSAVLPMLHYTLLSYSRAVAQLTAPYELYSKTDARFLEGCFKFLRQEFNLSPKLTPAQFLTQAFAERKLLFVCDVIAKCVKLTEKEQRNQARAELTINERKLDELHSSRRRFEASRQNQDQIQPRVVKHTSKASKSKPQATATSSHTAGGQRFVGESLEQPLMLLGDPERSPSRSSASSRYSAVDQYPEEEEIFASFPQDTQDWSVHVIDQPRPQTHGDNPAAIPGHGVMTTDFVVNRGTHSLVQQQAPQSRPVHDHPSLFDAPTRVWTRDDIPSSNTSRLQEANTSRRSNHTGAPSANQASSALPPAVATTADVKELCEVVGSISEKMNSMAEAVNARMLLVEGRLKFMEESLAKLPVSLLERNSAEPAPVKDLSGSVSLASRDVSQAPFLNDQGPGDDFDVSRHGVIEPTMSPSKRLDPHATAEFVSGLKQRLNETKLLLEATKNDLASDPASPLNLDQLARLSVSLSPARANPSSH